MALENTQKSVELRLSKMAEELVGSEIIKLAGEIKQKISQGEAIHNFTIGDFAPSQFPIPQELTEGIIQAYRNGHTNYPAGNGMPELRAAVSQYIENYQNLSYSADEFLISGGARPLIFATYQAIVDPEDTVIFPVPSWNNNHYTHLSHGKKVMIETTAESNFMPLAEHLKPYIQEANLIALCSPLNPTGTTFSKEQLSEICQMVLEENARRSADQKPVYLMFDQIYWMLCLKDTQHHDPVSLFPEMRNYTIYIDGLSKAFCATGVRVGWAFGPAKIIGKMKSILGHVGAWAPKAEQMATAEYLTNTAAIDTYIAEMKVKVWDRLHSFYDGFQTLKQEGFQVDAIAPQAAIYLTVSMSLKGKQTQSGKILEKTEDVTQYLLNEAKLAIVPFYAFGASRDSDWYRLSIGTAKTEEIPAVIAQLRAALLKLN